MRSYEFRKYIDLINEANQVGESWDKPTVVNPKERGKYAGKTKAELLRAYNALKATGPHKQGSEEYGRMHELAFAIRAKGGWGKVKEDHLEKSCPRCKYDPCRCNDDHESKMMEKAPPGMEDLVLKLKREYPGEPAKAFATAWSIYNKKHGKNQ